MEFYYYTLAVSEIGTHKMKFKDRMMKEQAAEIGKKHCEEKGLEYIGTYDFRDIEYEEIELRKRLYSIK